MTNLPLKDSVLVTLADRNFVTQAKQLFSSVYWNGGWQGDYLLLAHGDISEQDLKWFRDKGITVFPCEPLTDIETAGAWHPAVVLDKFYLFTPYFKRWKRVVYLDADIIVRASLENLLEVNGFAAPESPGFSLPREEFVTDAKETQALFQELMSEYRLRGRAFNSGIMAFSTDIINGSMFSELRGLYGRFGALNRFGEEGTLNLFFYKRWKKFSLLYNTHPLYMKNRYQVPFNMIRAVIIHFVHEKLPKPWEPESLFYAEWRANLERADGININAPRVAAECWTADGERAYLLKIRVRMWFMWHRHMLRAADWLVGQVGRLVKRLSPHLYEQIRPKKSWFTV